VITLIFDRIAAATWLRRAAGDYSMSLTKVCPAGVSESIVRGPTRSGKQTCGELLHFATKASCAVWRDGRDGSKAAWSGPTALARKDVLLQRRTGTSRPDP
jgi:hypothetical protein